MAAPQQGTGYVNFGRYLNANQGALGNEASQLAQSDFKEAGNGPWQPSTPADYAANHQAAQNAYNDIQGLTNSGSLQNQVQKQYGEGQGNSAFDANLLGGSSQGQQTFQKAQSALPFLQNYLNTPPPSPPKPTPAPPGQSGFTGKPAPAPKAPPPPGATTGIYQGPYAGLVNSLLPILKDDPGDAGYHVGGTR